MWQAPNQRVTALQNAKKRQQERANRPLHLCRVRAEVRLIPHQPTEGQVTAQAENGEMTEVRVLLNDISMSGVGIYSRTPMNANLDIVITLDDPRRIQIKGKVIWSQEQVTSASILSSQAFKYRVGVRFIFAGPEDEEALRTFCAELTHQHVYNGA